MSVCSANFENTRITARALPALALALVLAACTTPSEREPKPIRTPLDAVQSVPAPSDATSPLSADVEQLQNARSAYERARERRAAKVKRQQAQCRRRENSRQVPIQDKSGDPKAAYCQTTP